MLAAVSGYGGPPGTCRGAARPVPSVAGEEPGGEEEVSGRDDLVSKEIALAAIETGYES